jgi:transposase
MTDHHRRLIRHSMEHLAYLEEEILELEKEITEHVKGHIELRVASDLAQTVPGIRETAAAAIIAETGPDMKQFPGPGKLASWIGVCPGNNITGGKRQSSQTTKGNPWARQTLVECAWSATRKKDSEPKRFYEGLKHRLKHKPALVATAHLLTLNVYHVLATGKPYAATPHAEFTSAKVQKLVRHHTRRIKRLQHWLTDHRQRCAPNA